MEKQNFYKILCSSTPQEINDFISKKGTKKVVNAITFITIKEKGESNVNGQETNS